jgi:Flp pilus assembly pilin Flp
MTATDSALPTPEGASMTNARTTQSIADALSADRAQALVEYALIIGVIALGTLVALTFLRDQLITVFSQTGNLL